MSPHNFYAHVTTKFCKHVKHCQADLLRKQVLRGVLRERFSMENANLQSIQHQHGAKELVAGACGSSETVPSQAKSYKSDCVKRPLQTVHVRKAAASVGWCTVPIFGYGLRVPN